MKEAKTDKEKKKIIIEKLKEVYDPEIPISVWELGLIYNLEVKDNKVNILMTLTSPQCPLSNLIIENIKEELEELDFIDVVNVELTFEPPWTPEMIKSDEDEEDEEDEEVIEEYLKEKKLNLPGSETEEVDEEEFKKKENVIDVDEKSVENLFNDNNESRKDEDEKIDSMNISKKDIKNKSEESSKNKIVDIDSNIDSNSLKFCHSCGKNENEVILLEGRFKGEKIYLCIDCLLNKFNDKENKKVKDKKKVKKNKK